MLGGNNALDNHTPPYRRHWLKYHILTELPNVTSVNQKNRRKSSVLFCPQACDVSLVQSALASEEDTLSSMKHIYKAAKVLRSAITAFVKETPVDAVHDMKVTSTCNDVPAELYTMIHWIMVGPVDELETEMSVNISCMDINQQGRCSTNRSLYPLYSGRHTLEIAHRHVD